MAKKKGSFLGKVFFGAAVAGGAALLNKWEKQAKEENRDIKDVAKEKVDNLVDDVNSGKAAEKVEELADKAVDFAEKTIDDFNSGELQANLQQKYDETVESVRSGEFKEKTMETAAKAKETLLGAKDGIVDMFDDPKETADDVNKEIAEIVEAAREQE